MTPLAHRIVKDLTLPPDKRAEYSDPVTFADMTDIHCFDCSAIWEAVRDLCYSVGKIVGSDHTAFLPAPRTWIETDRSAWLLEELADPQLVRATAFTFFKEDGGQFERDYIWRHAPFTVHLVKGVPENDLGWVYYPGWVEDDFTVPGLIISYLAFINAPRVIGRRQHMPHRGLEKRVRGFLGGAKTLFPMRAWTEILLECTPPKDLSDLPGYEAHLTGTKCLHFCRAHLRIRNSKLEFVRSHWRGDAALGIKQSRYILTKEKSDARST